MKNYFIITFSVILLLGGCASMQELTNEVIKARNTGKEGVTKVYPVTENQAWDITEAVFRWEKTDNIEEHKNENYVIAGMGMKMVAFGSVMGVWIEPVDSGHTMLTVVTRRRVASDIFTRLTAPRFYERFDKGVKIVKSGKELPVIPPQE
jgi:uncharacterized protein YceK